MLLEGKVAIITGASRGLGRDFALDFARKGASVVVAARSETEGNIPGTIHKTADQARSLGARVLPVKCDVTRQESVDDVIEKTLKEFGRIDILVNNAAVAWWPPVTETPLKRFELVLRVNLIGAFSMVKSVLPSMIKQNSGSIVNISSRAANKKVRGFSGISYGVSKAGLERFTWGLAAELGQYNIAVNAIKPLDPIGTEGMEANAGDNTDKSKWTTSDLMVKACTFMAAQDASGVTGTVATDVEFCQWHGLV